MHAQDSNFAYPPNYPKIEVSSPKFCFFERKFFKNKYRRFSENFSTPKNLGQATAFFPATSPLNDRRLSKLANKKNV